MVFPLQNGLLCLILIQLADKSTMIFYWNLWPWNYVISVPIFMDCTFTLSGQNTMFWQLKTWLLWLELCFSGYITCSGSSFIHLDFEEADHIHFLLLFWEENYLGCWSYVFFIELWVMSWINLGCLTKMGHNPMWWSRSQAVLWSWIPLTQALKPVQFMSHHSNIV